MHPRDQKSQRICLWCLEALYHDATIFDLFLKRDICCQQCDQQLRSKRLIFDIGALSCEAHCIYDVHIERALYRLKEDKDIAIATLFFKHAKIQLKRNKNSAHVLMPSSQDKIVERGFDHLHHMVKQHKLDIVDCLRKKDGWKQATKSKQDRKAIKQNIILMETERIKDKDVILVDDVCTTGSTLLTAYELIKPHAKTVRAVVFAVHPIFYEDTKRL